MFQKENLIKHYVFLFYDLLVVAVSFILANQIRFGGIEESGQRSLFYQVLLIALAAAFLGNRILRLDHHVFDRGLFAEFMAVVN